MKLWEIYGKLCAARALHLKDIANNCWGEINERLVHSQLGVGWILDDPESHLAKLEQENKRLTERVAELEAARAQLEATVEPSSIAMEGADHAEG